MKKKIITFFVLFSLFFGIHSQDNIFKLNFHYEEERPNTTYFFNTILIIGGTVALSFIAIDAIKNNK